MARIDSVCPLPMSDEQQEFLHTEGDAGPIASPVPGSITVVGGGSDDILPDIHNTNRRRGKRSGDHHSHGSTSEGVLPQARRPRVTDDREEGDVPIEYTDEREFYGESAPIDSRSQVERLLDAKRRRRRMGRHVAEEQIKEDLEDVKRFLALPEADRDAYLSIYEYDGNEEEVVEGLAKLSSLGIRTWLAYNRPAKDYEFAALALDNPKVKDALASAWGCLDIAKLADKKPIKAAVALGHVGDVLLNTSMSVYQAVNARADDRDRALRIERKKHSGVQSVFDLSSSNGNTNETYSTGTTQGVEHQQLPNETTNIVDQI